MDYACSSSQAHFNRKMAFERVSLLCNLSSVPQHGKIVTCGTRDNKQVPYEMGVAHPHSRKEPHTARVCNTSRQEPEDSRRGHLRPQRPDSYEDQPPHSQV